MDSDRAGSRRFLDRYQVLFVEGDVANCAYLVETGRLEASVERTGRQHILGQLGPGSLVGEMSVIDSGPRCATVRALEPSVLQVLERSYVEERVHSADPLIRHMLQRMMGRYRGVLGRVGAADEVARPGSFAEDVETGDRALATERLRAEQALHLAFERREFVLHYQPIMRLRDDSVAGFEALIRWLHPERGLVPPDDFIPATEESGLIVRMGHWIIDTAASALAQLSAANPGRRPAEPLFMTVNLAGRQFTDPELTSVLETTIHHNKLEPGSLRLEVTESSLLNRIEEAADLMGKCRNLGIRLAVDDFGTGYSALSYLYKLPVSSVKLARPFIQDLALYPESGKIVGAVSKLARELQMESVAEGIEVEHQASAVRSLGIEYGQGFYYSAAMPLPAAGAFIQRPVHPPVAEKP